MNSAIARNVLADPLVRSSERSPTRSTFHMICRGVSSRRGSFHDSVTRVEESATGAKTHVHCATNLNWAGIGTAPGTKTSNANSRSGSQLVTTHSVYQNNGPRWL